MGLSGAGGHGAVRASQRPVESLSRTLLTNLLPQQFKSTCQVQSHLIGSELHAQDSKEAEGGLSSKCNFQSAKNLPDYSR